MVSGIVRAWRPGGCVCLPGKTTQIARIVTMDGDLDCAAAGEAVTLTVRDEIDIASWRRHCCRDGTSRCWRNSLPHTSSG